MKGHDIECDNRTLRVGYEWRECLEYATSGASNSVLSH
jgi:hypothetical protein